MDKRRADILLFIEHVARELDIACAVKYLIGKRHGLDLEIASRYYDLPKTLKMYHAPPVVVVPYCRSVENVIIGEILLAWHRTIFVDLAYEQVFQKINRAVKAPRDEFAQRYVIHLAWSESVADYLTAYGTARENIIINGNPVLELYRPPYNTYFCSREKLAETFGLNPGKRWVFIPENYGAAFYSEGRLRKYVRVGTKGTEAQDYQDFALDSLQKVARWFKQAAEQGDAEIIVRPRPATPKAHFEQVCVEAAGQLPEQMHIIKEGTVREWILASDAVGSSYSTTLIEAAVARRPIFMLAPVPFPEFLHNDWYDLVPNVESFSSFMAIVNGQVSTDSWQLLHQWATSTMLSRGDVISNLVDLLAKIYRKEADVPDRIYSKRPIPFREASLQYRTKRKLRALAGKILTAGRNLTKPAASDEPERNATMEYDRFKNSDVTMRVKRWERVLTARQNST